MKTIKKIAKEIGLDYSSIELYGANKAKIPLSNFPKSNLKNNNSMVVITAITPTPAGEGKSTTAIAKCCNKKRLIKSNTYELDLRLDGTTAGHLSLKKVRIT